VTNAIHSSDRTAIEKIVASLEAAWNAGDGKAFGAPFSTDADFVNIRATTFKAAMPLLPVTTLSFGRSTPAV
jgi:hypothetical protein